MIGKNNPFNIRYNNLNKWIGLIGQTNGFCDFESIDLGIRAAGYLVIRSYRKRGIVTIADIIRRFAPPTENNTQNYIDFVCDKISCFPFDVPDTIDRYARLLWAMSIFESNPLRYDEIFSVLVIYFRVV